MSKKFDYNRFFLLAKPFTPIIVLSLFLSVVVVLLDGLSLWFSGSLLQNLFSETGGDQFLQKPEFSWAQINLTLKYYTWKFLTSSGGENNIGVLATICILIPILFFVKNVTFYLQKTTISLLNLRIVERLRNQFYDHIMNLPTTFYDNNKSGDIISYFVRDLSEIRITLTTFVNKMFLLPLKIILFFILLIIISPKLTFFISLVYPLMGVVLNKAGKTIRRRSSRTHKSFSEVVSVLSETIANIRVVKMFSSIRFEIDRFENENKKFIKNSFRAQLVSNALAPFTEFMSLTMTSLLLWFAGKEILSGESSFSSGDFLRYLLILFSAYSPIKQLTNVHSKVQSGIAAAQRVFDVFDEPVEMNKGKEDTDIDFKKEIFFDNVTFSYPGHEKIVLNNLSFSVEKGQTVALVGASGCGKSTILDLLPSFYNVKSGDIKIDGVSINDYTLHSLRSLYGIVSQETILFNDSVRNNIAYAEKNSNIDKVKDALKAANAWEFVEKLSDGLDTVIGEHGVNLSGGQRQRLAIARALYKNPQILIFDEATSALDTESEKLVQSAVSNLIQDRTSIVVAHRLSTIQNADVIFVLDEGKIVEQGTHEELLKLNRRYSYLYNIQFSGSGE